MLEKHKKKIATIFLLMAVSAPGMADCRELRVQLNLLRSKMVEFDRLRKELDEKYSKYVREDFDEQAAGIVIGLKRNKAMKVKFAQNRLNETAEKTQKSLVLTQDSYCNSCSGERNLTQSYCEECRNFPICGRSAMTPP